jgi:hypothetical protein
MVKTEYQSTKEAIEKGKFEKKHVLGLVDLLC